VLATVTVLGEGVADPEALGITELSTNLTDPEEILALVAVLGRPDLCRLYPWRASFS
jgi:hypothetical protein